MMQDRRKDIRAAISIAATDMRKEVPEKAEVITAFEFLIGNLLVDIHTIALAQAAMALVSHEHEIIPGKTSSKTDRVRG